MTKYVKLTANIYKPQSDLTDAEREAMEFYMDEAACKQADQEMRQWAADNGYDPDHVEQSVPHAVIAVVTRGYIVRHNPNDHCVLEIDPLHIHPYDVSAEPDVWYCDRYGSRDVSLLVDQFRWLSK